MICIIEKGWIVYSGKAIGGEGKGDAHFGHFAPESWVSPPSLSPFFGAHMFGNHTFDSPFPPFLLTPSPWSVAKYCFYIRNYTLRRSPPPCSSPIKVIQEKLAIFRKLNLVCT